MWKRRTGRGRRAPAARQVWPRVLLWALLAIETIWLGAFMLSNGSPLPPLAERWLARPGAGPSGRSPAQERRLEARQDEATELELRHLLATKGSQGPVESPPPAAPEK